MPSRCRCHKRDDRVITGRHRWTPALATQACRRATPSFGLAPSLSTSASSQLRVFSRPWQALVRVWVQTCSLRRTFCRKRCRATTISRNWCAPHHFRIPVASHNALLTTRSHRCLCCERSTISLCLPPAHHRGSTDPRHHRCSRQPQMTHDTRALPPTGYRAEPSV